ncbi:aldo/keto reductase [Nonomuraea sp. NPDC004580]|uniref:aldo/keto reductase n=1 Tax=Nonomuraea sp. NPDC004580 TaxID=3154552 RepID=UPI0033B51177
MTTTHLGTRRLGRTGPTLSVKFGGMRDPSGQLSGTVAGIRAGSPRFQGANLDHNAALAGRLQDLAAAKGVSVAQLAIAWVAAQGDDIVPIVGSRTPDQVTTMIGADAVSFTAEDLARIEDLVPRDAAKGDRYPTALMAALDSERRNPN